MLLDCAGGVFYVCKVGLWLGWVVGGLMVVFVFACFGVLLICLRVCVCVVC